MNVRSTSKRWLSPTLYALIGLAFLLPFATVSCDGAETSFTGAQLVTWSVTHGGVVQDADGGDLGERVEDEASGLAVAALTFAALGFALGILGLQKGPGWCSAAGLVTTLLLAQRALDPFGPDVTFHSGYVLTLLLFMWAAGLHAWRALRRRREAAGRGGTDPSRSSTPDWRHPHAR